MGRPSQPGPWPAGALLESARWRLSYLGYPRTWLGMRLAGAMSISVLRVFLCSLPYPHQQLCHAILEGFPSIWLCGQLGQKKPCQCHFSIRALIPGLQFGSYTIHNSSDVLELLDVPLYGLDVPLGVYVVIRVQDGSGELGGGEELWEQLSLRVVLKARYSLHNFGQRGY